MEATKCSDWLRKLGKLNPAISLEGKRGQAYNLNIAVSDLLVSDGRGNWHISPKCDTSPKTNRAFWDRKRATNMARDRRVNRQLRRQGWKVIRIWQHSLQKCPSVCLKRIRRALLTATDMMLAS
jgi:hypothetical protein